MSNQGWKLLTLAVVIVGAIFYLFPNYQYYFQHTAEERKEDSGEVMTDLRSKILHLGLDLQGGMHVVLEADLEQLPEEERDDAIDRVEAVLRNRVDEFGVSEPVIQRQGENRVIVDLAGVEDPEQVRNLIGTTARLEFRMCKSAAEAGQILDRVDRYLAAADPDTANARPLSSQLAIFYRPELGMHSSAFVRTEAINDVEDLLETAGVDSVLGPGAEILFANEEIDLGQYKGRRLYFLNRAYELTGDQLKTASRDYNLDITNPNEPGVLLTLNNQGARRFLETTRDNVGNYMAIVLDNKVHSAPRIRQTIRGGVATISGGFGDEEALTLATVLRAGALPVDVKIIEERTVGASLGQDLIQKGLRAGLVGLALVIVFVVIWYKGSGGIAVLALALNITLIFAGLSMLRGTLTLPGIAGIVLTIGMAVDANVLIFERIREELRNGKTARAAIDSGYGRAFTTIIDSNLTTLIAALVLFQYGTGPIRGFAVTLSIGIVANIFCAVLVTRLMFDALYRRSGAQTVSI